MEVALETELSAPAGIGGDEGGRSGEVRDRLKPDSGRILLNDIRLAFGEGRLVVGELGTGDALGLKPSR